MVILGQSPLKDQSTVQLEQAMVYRVLDFVIPPCDPGKLGNKEHDM